MSPSTHPNCFPMAKGTVVMTAIILLFTLLIVVVFLWYDLQVQKIQHTTEHQGSTSELPILHP